MRTKSEKRKSRLQSYAKRRARRPESTVTLISTLLAKDSLMTRMIHEHSDLLQNLEFVLVTVAGEFDEVDDCVIERTLRNWIAGKPAEDPVAEAATHLLSEIRESRPDVDDTLWANAMRVVYTSLRDRSSCQAGETSYLGFVSRFVM